MIFTYHDTKDLKTVFFEKRFEICVFTVINVFFNGAKSKLFLHSGKNPYRDFLRSNSKSPVQREIRIGMFSFKRKVFNNRGKTPISLFRLNSKSPVQREISIGIVLSNAVSSTDGNPYSDIFSQTQSFRYGDFEKFL